MKIKHMLMVSVALAGLASGALATDPEGIEITRFLPEFNTEETVKSIEQGLAPTKDLDHTLRESTERIWQLVEQYRENPSHELEDQIYAAVADSGEKIIQHISDLEGQRDRLRDELRELNVNVEDVVRNLDTYTSTLDGRVKDVLEEARALKNELKQLAQQLTEDPNDVEAREAFRKKVIELKRLRLKLGLYVRNKKMYAKLSGQIGQVSDFFAQFETRLDTVLDSLVLQKRMIAMNLTVLRDKAKVLAWLRGESNGQSGVGHLMTQLGDLSNSLNSFGKAMDVMAHLGGDFDNFAEMVPELSDGSLGEVAAVAEDELDTLIEQFARKE